MIQSFRHKGLKRLYEKDDSRGVLAEYVQSCATSWRDSTHLDRLKTWISQASGCTHSKGNCAGFWAVTVRANWRMIFQFDEENACEVDYLDYH